MKIPMRHTTVKKLLSMLQACYHDQIHLDSELWSDFNLVAIASDLMNAYCHRKGDFIDLADDTVDWIAMVIEGSDDEDFISIAEFISPQQ